MAYIERFVNFNNTSLTKGTQPLVDLSKLKIGGLYKTIKYQLSSLYRVDGYSYTFRYHLPLKKHDIIMYCGIKENYLQWLYGDSIFVTDSNFITHIELIN